VLNKVSGGIIHVHENVHEDILQNWAHVTLCTAFEALFHSLAQQAQSDGSTADAAPAYRMSVKCIHLEKVKSYAPRVMHIVADLRCVPVPL
jgi:tRNA G37 N-methylase Trm5